MAQPGLQLVDEAFSPELGDVLRLGGFLASLYVGSKLCCAVKAPSLVGEIAVGVVWLVLGAMPAYLDHSLQVIGKLGLLLAVFEGGVSMDLAELSRTGVRAFVLGSTGLISPIIVVGCAMVLLGYPMMESIACGIVLSSTAIGFIMQLMNEANILTTPMGRLVVSAAMIDDVLSLVALSVLTSMKSGGGGGPGAWQLARPLVASVGILAFGVAMRAAAARAFKHGGRLSVRRCSRLSSRGGVKLAQPVDSEAGDSLGEPVPSCVGAWRAEPDAETADEAAGGLETKPPVGEQTGGGASAFCSGLAKAHWASSVAILLALGLGLTLSWGAEALHSTELLGAFMAGLVATAWAPFVGKWELRTPLAVGWLVRIFFACSVGFQVPIQAMMSSNLVDVTVLTLAAIVGKFVSGIFAAPMCTPGHLTSAVQVGFAMVGRGEIGFLVAATCVRSGLMTQQCYSATIWALVLATIFGPIMFRLSLRLDRPSGTEGSS